MSGLDFLRSLNGSWSGDNRLWLEPGKPPFASKTAATVIHILGGRFVRLDYTWSFDGEEQAGSYLFGYESKSELVTAAWIDSWHNGERLMLCRGGVGENGSVNVLGFYPAPTGPDWGWRTIIEPADSGPFRLQMYNILPTGEAFLAVEAVYHP